MSEGVGLSPRPPDTVLGPPPEGAAARLQGALAEPASRRRRIVSEVVRAHPDWPDGWAELGKLADDEGDVLDAYAYFRVGYHRGLDALRKAGWRGSGYVRWAEVENRGFLACVDGLRRAALSIGEDGEAARCGQFLRQLDPAWRTDGPE